MPMEAITSPRCPDHPKAPQEMGFGLAGGGYGPYSYCSICCRILSKTQEYDGIRVLGVFRDAGNDKSLSIGLSAVPSDDDLRSLHEFLRGWKSDG